MSTGLTRWSLVSDDETVEQPADSINEFVAVGEFGFLRMRGPWSVEKEGTKWTIIVPHDDSRGRMGPENEGQGAVLIADGHAVGGGIIDVVDSPDGEGELHIVVDQYARGE